MPQLTLILDHLIEKPLRKKDIDVKAAIILGLFQLFKMRTPPHAAISETVELCKTIKKPWACALVNASLRKFSDNKAEICNSLQRDSKAFLYNHPDWFASKLSHNWPDHWQDILYQNDQHPPLSLRININKVSRETLSEKLQQQGLENTLTPYSDYGITLLKPTDVTSLPGFADGDISVQDEAAQLAADLVSPQPGERILDACSAPGGKLVHLLEIAPQCEIQGLELEQHRADRIEENLERCKLTCPVLIGDASKQDWWDKQAYDRILLDAPCTASGVIRRNPDIKHLRQAEDIHQTAQLQRSILNNLWRMLKSGGTLVYATCSIFPQENEKQIQNFIKENSDATHLPIEAAWGVERPFGRQLFPQQNGHDGFYYAKLIKA